MRKWHKWLGLFFTFFIVMFAISGILLNHRKVISEFDIPRSILPADYHCDNWNNNAVRGSLKLDSNSVLLYAGSGVWLTDTLGSYFEDFMTGMRKGTDNRITNNMLRTADDEIFAVTTFGLYRLDKNKLRWQDLSSRIDFHDRFCDLAVKGDTLILVTRSNLFVATSPYDQFSKITVSIPDNFKREATLFRTIWTLHSGELFGLAGKLVVDLLGVVVILLSVTGVLLTIFPIIIKRRKKRRLAVNKPSRAYRTSLKWHNTPGVLLLLFFLVITVSGIFLRPPLMIAIIRTKVKTIPGTILHKPNVWYDKLRTLRYDPFEQNWILYTSDGFFTLEQPDGIPVKMERIPPISVMGVNVLEQADSTSWIVGSFSGLYYWNRQTGESINAYTMEKVKPRRPGPPVITNAVTGYSADFGDNPVVFDYSKGAKRLHPDIPFAAMPALIGEKGKISLWHLSLEVHVGRIYKPILGALTDWFIFLSGVILFVILVTGYIVYRRHHRKRKQ